MLCVYVFCFFFFFKQKTAYEMRISDWSSDVCSSDLLAPPGLNRCFYADNGSSAVEVALKMSFHYWRNTGNTKKTRFIALENSYHGETLGALAMGGPSMYRDTYAPLLLQPIHEIGRAHV